MPNRIVTNSLSNLLHSARIIPDLVDLLAPGRICYLVGGALRNVHLGLPVSDFDFTLADDPTDLAQKFAARLDGHWFSLDEARAQSRVVVKTESGPVFYDFAPWRAATLEEDLRLRDFTINAMALPLTRGERKLPDLVDPLRGRFDLSARVLRCCSANVLEEDPLRVLKGVRHCLGLGMKPDTNTFEKMGMSAPLLTGTASERIRAELGQIFSEPVEEREFDLFGRLGLPDILFGAPGPAGSFARGSEMMQRTQSWMQNLALLDKEEKVVGHFDDVVEEYWPRRAVLKLGAFFKGYRPQNAAMRPHKRLGLGKRATALLKGLTALSAQRYEEIERLSSTTRGRALWIDSLGPGRGEALVLLLALAEADPSSDGPAALKLLADYMAVSDSQGRIADLVSGTWVREELRIEDGPLIGDLLNQLRNAEIDGEVTGPEEAKQFLRRKCPNKD